MGAQIWRPRLLFRLAKRAYVISVFFVLFIAAYYSYQQYRIWEISTVGKLLLPPRQPIGYFLHYAYVHFWMNSLIALAISMLGWLSARLLNRRHQERFFEPVEPWLFGIGLLMTGHPGWIYNLVALFVFAIISHFSFLISRKKSSRISFYWFWLPAAILGILVQEVIK